MLRLLRFLIVVEFPALDRLVTFLEAQEQQEIDYQVQRLQILTARLQVTNTRLSQLTTNNQSQTNSTTQPPTEGNL